MLNLPLNVVLQNVIRQPVALQVAFYIVQLHWRNQNLHTVSSLMPEIQLLNIVLYCIVFNLLKNTS